MSRKELTLEERKEMIVKVLLERGFKLEPSGNECYVNTDTGVQFKFIEEGVVISFIDKHGTFNEFSILCMLDQVHYKEDAIESNTASECYLEVEFSKENKIRPLPSWYK